jgi:C4-dicarboxylate-specific signal transduction histidine kinase
MQVEAEVSRLEDLKSSKMKELVWKKRAELEEICRKTHLVQESDAAIEKAIESGNVQEIDHWMSAVLSFFFKLLNLHLPFSFRTCRPCLCA